METQPDIDNRFVIDREMIGGRADVRSTDVPVDPEVALQLSGLTNEAIKSVTIDAQDGPKTLSRDGGPKVYANNLGLNDPLQVEERAVRLQERMEEICIALAEQVYERMVGPDNVRRGPVFGTAVGDTYLNELLNDGVTFMDDMQEKIGVQMRRIMDEQFRELIRNNLGEYVSAKLQSIDIDGNRPFANNTFMIMTELSYNNIFGLRLIIRKSNGR